jgi:cellulose synthase/poly-beta-1,6-N-acetylglucosamine synthase-like glycosyltransferase
MSEAVKLVYALLIGFFATMNVGYLVLLFLGIGQARRRTHQQRFTRFDPIAASPATVPISVIVAAHNEETVICNSVMSMLRSQHPEFEVIVVNDGSTDGTLDALKRRFELEPRDAFYPAPLKTARVRAVYRSPKFPNLWVIDKENGRQADAANAGVNIARYRYIAQADADCVFEPETLLRAVRVVNFDPARVIGAAGQLRLSNGLDVQDGEILHSRLPRRWVERFQVIEYMAAFLTHRLGWGLLNGVPVVSGGFGIWRKDVVVGVGGYATDVTHHDLELTVAAHEHFRSRGIAYEIPQVPDSIVWTQAPATWKDLRSQRKRWQRHLLEVLWKYRQMLFNPRYGTVGLITMPYMLIYEGLGPLVEAFSYAFVGVLAILGLLDVRALLVFIAFSSGLSAVLRLGALFTDVSLFATYRRGEIAKLAIAAILEPVVYRPTQLPGRIRAFSEFLRGYVGHEAVPRADMGLKRGAVDHPVADAHARMPARDGERWGASA